jgi:hypothetical protein
MKRSKASLSATAVTVGTKNDHSKLVSLLALAAGAAAMPQTSNADIIYTASGAKVSWDGFHSFNTGASSSGAFPGNVQLGFDAHKSGFFSSTEIRFVTGGKRGSGYLKFKLLLTNQPKLWSQIAAAQVSNATFATARSTRHGGNSFSGLYLAFEFKDSTQAGSPMRYGWAGLDLANGNLSTLGDYPALTVSAWAYDTTGAQIPMGAQGPVPEPNSMALLALGALTLGAKGVRSWRRQRATASQS